MSVALGIAIQHLTPLFMIWENKKERAWRINQKGPQLKKTLAMSGLVSPWGTRTERGLIRHLKQDVAACLKNQVY